jgi:hypothetical protein
VELRNVVAGSRVGSLLSLAIIGGGNGTWKMEDGVSGHRTGCTLQDFNFLRCE